MENKEEIIINDTPAPKVKKPLTDRMAAGASMGWAAAGVGILGRLPDPFTGQNTVCLTGQEPDGPRRRPVYHIMINN